MAYLRSDKLGKVDGAWIEGSAERNWSQRGNRGRLVGGRESSSDWQLSLEEQLGGSATMNSNAARVPVKWSPRNGCLIPLISRGFRFCPVSVAFNKLPSLLQPATNIRTYREDRRWNAGFLEAFTLRERSSIFSNRILTFRVLCVRPWLKSVLRVYLFMGNCAKRSCWNILVLKYINFFVIFILKCSIFDINLVLNCICV